MWSSKIMALLLLPLSLSRGHVTPELCRRGQFLNEEQKRCEPCPSSHFMPDPLHSQIRCYPCSHARPNSAEILLEACTDVYDAIIGCRQGFFLQLASTYDDNLIRCYPCTKCSETKPPSYEIRPCGTSVDTVCCSDLSMVAVRRHGEYGYDCHDTTSRQKATYRPLSGNRIHPEVFLETVIHTSTERAMAEEGLRETSTGFRIPFIVLAVFLSICLIVLILPKFGQRKSDNCGYVQKDQSEGETNIIQGQPKMSLNFMLHKLFCPKDNEEIFLADSKTML